MEQQQELFDVYEDKFDDGFNYLNFILEEEKNKLYYKAKDIHIISGVDVAKKVRKKYIFIYENEIFISEEGFNSIFFKLPLFYRSWYYVRFIPFIYTFII